MNSAPAIVVLLVDDDAVLLRLLARILDRVGYVVLAHTDPRDALDQLSHGTIHVVVSDVTMPEMSGFALLSKVREQKPDVPVVLMTGQDESGSRQRAIEQGAFAFLRKPFDPESFERTVFGAAQHYRAAHCASGSAHNVA